MPRFSASFVEQYRARIASGESAAAPRATARRGGIGSSGLLAKIPSALGAGGKVRILGVDTSLRCTGLAIIDANGGAFTLVDARPIPNSARLSLPECLVNIAETLEKYIEEFRPDEVAMEGIFFCRNARTSLVLGHARGVVVATCARRNLPMSEYPPARVKQAVTGTGRATKDQMQRMMQRVFALAELPQEDSADAMAIALAHAHQRRIYSLAAR